MVVVYSTVYSGADQSNVERVSMLSRILLSTLTSVASDLFNYSLRLDNELSARPPRGRHGL